MRPLSGLIFLGNFAAAAVFLDAMLGTAATMLAFISTAIVWYAEPLGATRTDYFVRHWIERGGPPPDENAIVIDKESSPSVIRTLGWLFLFMSTMYTVYLLLTN